MHASVWLTAVKGEYANTEAQFGSSGPVHAEGEVEKEESYRTKLQLFSLRAFTVASPFHQRVGEKGGVCVKGSGGLLVGFWESGQTLKAPRSSLV